MRGEYWGEYARYEWLVELPPRARRILHAYIVACRTVGTTSACAENTGGALTAIKSIGNYLRVRGEYANGKDAWVNSLELPPRARRIRIMRQILGFIVGTTSACAENTLNELGLL